MIDTLKRFLAGQPLASAARHQQRPRNITAPRAAIETMRSLTNTLANALLPVISGLTRNKLLDGGATQRDVRIQGSSINYYEQGPQTGSDASRDQRAQLPILLVHSLV